MYELLRIVGVIGLLGLAMPVLGSDLGVDAHAGRGRSRTVFDPSAAQGLAEAEVRFLRDLFGVTDEAARLHSGGIAWLLDDSGRGLHGASYLEDLDALRSRLDGLPAPPRLRSVHELIARALELQRGFVADWFEAQRKGRAFESQLTHEYAYHEGLHRSHRMLLQAFAELHALFPAVGEPVHRSFHDHLRALDLK